MMSSTLMIISAASLAAKRACYFTLKHSLNKLNYNNKLQKPLILSYYQLFRFSYQDQILIYLIQFQHLIIKLIQQNHIHHYQQ